MRYINKTKNKQKNKAGAAIAGTTKIKVLTSENDNRKFEVIIKKNMTTYILS